MSLNLMYEDSPAVVYVGQSLATVRVDADGSFSASVSLNRRIGDPASHDCAKLIEPDDKCALVVLGIYGVVAGGDVTFAPK